MRTALLTGGSGFVGGYLSALLRELGWYVVILDRNAPSIPGLEHLSLDLADTGVLARAVDGLRPDVIFHLAASSRRTSPTAEKVVADSVVGTISLCRAVRSVGLATRVVIAGSSAQYGAIPRLENPITEDARCRPVSVYGHAKLAAEEAALALAADGALDLVPVRAFNHVGPGEGDGTVAGALASAVVRVIDGAEERIHVRDGDAVRDFTDVRDIARGYLALAEHGSSGRVYNLCSGRAVAVRDVIDTLLDEAGLAKSVVDLGVRREGGVPYQVGSPRRVHDEIGWEATIPLARSLADLLASLRLRPPNPVNVSANQAMPGKVP